MPVTLEEVQNLLDRIEATRQRIGVMGEPARGFLQLVEPRLGQDRQTLGVDAAGRINENNWNALTAEQRAGVVNRLSGVERALTCVAESDDDGPKDERSLMFKTYASNASIVLLAALFMVGTVATLWCLYRIWPTSNEQPSEAIILITIILMGALGGLLHAGASLVIYVGNRQLRRSWVIYYLLMPFEGAALAPIVYLLLRVGVLGTGGKVEHLNTFGLYAFAGLTGLFSKQAIEMLRDVFAVIFKKVQAKDSAQEKQSQTVGTQQPPPGGQGGAGP